MNKGIFVGNLTADPVMRTTPNGKNVCNFTVAVTSGWGDNKKTDYIQVAAWGATGEVCSKYLSKGKKALVVGSVSAKAYNDKSGEARANITLTASEVEFLSSGFGNGNSGGQGYQKGDMMKAQGGEAPAAPQAQNFTDISNTYNGEDFPF